MSLFRGAVPTAKIPGVSRLGPSVIPHGKILAARIIKRARKAGPLMVEQSQGVEVIIKSSLNANLKDTGNYSYIMLYMSFRCQGIPECLKSKKMQEVWMYNLLRHSSWQLPVAILNYQRISSGASVEFKWSTQSKHTLGQECQSPALSSVGGVLRMKSWRDLFLLNITFSNEVPFHLRSKLLGPLQHNLSPRRCPSVCGRHHPPL